MIKSNGGIIGPDNVTTGGPFGSASGVFKLGEVTDLIKDSKWPTAGPASYQVANSLRFNKGDDPSLSRSTGDGNERIGTFSFWMKSDDEGVIFRIYTDGNNFFDIGVDGNRQLQVRNKASGSYNLDLRTNQVFRDPSAWKHIFIVIDTTQSTESNRAKMFINGTQVTSFGASTYPSQNDDLFMNANSKTAEISGTSGVRVNGYLAEFVLIDGTVKAVTDFGEFDEDSGIWKPIDVSGLSGDKGVNGFYLDFEDSSALGNCAFGGTDFTVSNLAATDQSTDTCTNNFATLNPLYNAYLDPTFSEGNLKITKDDSWSGAKATIGVSTGKWYWEIKLTGTMTDHQHGVQQENVNESAQDPQQLTGTTVFYNHDGGEMRTDGTATTADYGTFSSGDIMGLALDMDAGSYGQITIYKNGSAIVSDFNLSSSSTLVMPHFSIDNSTVECNFGSPPYAISSGNADGNGYGNFEYSVPSGYYSLCSKNLAEYG